MNLDGEEQVKIVMMMIVMMMIVATSVCATLASADVETCCFAIF